MPDDLVASAVSRCVDANVRKHHELTMDDSFDYQQLKAPHRDGQECSSLSGDTYLKLVQNSMSASSSTGPVPMDADQVGQVAKGNNKGKQKGKDKKGGGWFPYGYGGKYGGKNSKGQERKRKPAKWQGQRWRPRSQYTSCARTTRPLGREFKAQWNSDCH